MKSFPLYVKSFMENVSTELISIEEMHGVNPGRGAFSFKIHTSDGSYILKNCTEKREAEVYTHFSSFFRGKNINIPEIFGSLEESNENWIFIEYIPHEFPKSRWYGDSEQLFQLYKLHSSTCDSELNFEDPYPFDWNELLIKRIEHLLPAGIIPVIDELRKQSADLFVPFCCISGDPNPTNWRVRENGDLVLFDFERFGYGTPAIDLAITIPGFGSEDGSQEAEIAGKYISYWNEGRGRFPLTPDELVQQVKLAKIWAAIDFLANNHETMPLSLLPTYIQQLKQKLWDMGTGSSSQRR